MTTRTDNLQPRADAQALAQTLERIESLERRLMMARAMAMDLRDWIERHKQVDEEGESNEYSRQTQTN